MWCTSINWPSRHRQRLTPVMLVMTTAYMLSACGGGGSEGSVASTPPPPAPAPASPSIVSATAVVETTPAPATRGGTFNTIALIADWDINRNAVSNARVAASSEVKITVVSGTPASPDSSYTLDFSFPLLPGNKSSLTSIIKSQSADVFPNGGHASYADGSVGEYSVSFGQAVSATFTYSDGSQKIIRIADFRLGSSEQRSEQYAADGMLWHRLTYDVGLSHVSLGEWAWEDFTPGADGAWVISDAGTVYFVHGDRTPAAEMPVSGTASYTASSLGGVAIGLSADFGQRTMAAQLNRDYSSGGDPVGGYETTWGLDLHGTGTIDTLGSFGIPLTGSIINSPTTHIPATGSLDGAFFGPNAEQVGGVLTAGGVFDDGGVPATLRVSDAFVGTRN